MQYCAITNITVAQTCMPIHMSTTIIALTDNIQGNTYLHIGFTTGTSFLFLKFCGTQKRLALQIYVQCMIYNMFLY